MTKSFTADVRNWTEKAKRNAVLIVKQSIQDAGQEMTNAEDGIVRGAPFKEGVVPVDEAELINSSVVIVDGATSGRGEGGQGPDFTGALAGFEAGDYVEIGFTAKHARRREYGFSGQDSLGRTYDEPGRFMVRNAAQQWNTIVQGNAAKLKD
jgi:hypothetical protein